MGVDDAAVGAVERRYLRRALTLARRGRYGVSPNPMVGAVVVRGDEVVGEGWHRRVGGDHAEIEALAQAGGKARGATLFVTLEPCDHHGRTPPCSKAVVAAGVRRVVVCHRDPDPRVAGRGLARLAAAGIDVAVGELAEEALRLNLRFLIPRVLGRPAVTLKWAMSLDGKIATREGDSQWISSPAGRKWGARLREENDAIVVGIGTALADDPRLNRRLDLASGTIARVVMDRKLRLPPTAKMMCQQGPVWVYTERRAVAPRRALEKAGARVIVVAKVEPKSVLADLAGRGVAGVLVEGGGAIAAAFVEAGCYDRVAVNCAPLLIGGQEALGPLAGKGAAVLRRAPRLDKLRARRCGEDLILEGLRQGCLQDLLLNVDG